MWTLKHHMVILLQMQWVLNIWSLQLRMRYGGVCYFKVWLSQWPLGDVAVIFTARFCKASQWLITSCGITPRWMPQPLGTVDESTLVQVMAWYLSKCLSKSTSSYGVTRPQWVKNNSYWLMFARGMNILFNWNLLIFLEIIITDNIRDRLSIIVLHKLPKILCVALMTLMNSKIIC